MKHDTASLKTKKKLMEALKKEMKISKITVCEIIKECDVNRKTFYYHFEDINDLV